MISPDSLAWTSPTKLRSRTSGTEELEEQKLFSQVHFKKAKKNMNIPSVYINLDRRPDRKSHCQRVLHSFENLTRVSAVDGGFVKYTIKDVFPYYDTRENRRCDKSIKLLRSIRMSPGEIGCALSHLNVWRSMETPLLILEDDILLVNNFQTRLKKNLLSLPDDWHILYLGYMNPRENGLAKFITPELS